MKKVILSVLLLSIIMGLQAQELKVSLRISRIKAEMLH